jgi:DNA-binding response OmpR family regulator
MSSFICEALGETYRVATAFDGNEALAKAFELRPDLRLVDVMMPEMGGEELVATLRRRAELSTTSIVILTAKADEPLRIRLLREGAQDFIVKPFLEEELRARVANLLGAKLAQDALRASEIRFRALVEHASDGAQKISGYSESEAIGAPLELLVRFAFNEPIADVTTAEHEWCDSPLRCSRLELVLWAMERDKHNGRG